MPAEEKLKVAVAEGSSRNPPAPGAGFGHDYCFIWDGFVRISHVAGLDDAAQSRVPLYCSPALGAGSALPSALVKSLFLSGSEQTDVCVDAGVSALRHWERSQAMPDPVGCARPWRVIAAEVAVEPNPEKLLELIRELNQALDLQTRQNVNKAPAED